MASVGEKLRNARLDGGLDLSQLADRTKISSRYLDAIERDDRTALPGGFFYKNWVLQYAACLSLDLAAIASEVDSFTAQDAEPALPGQGKLQMPKEMRPAPIDLGFSREKNRLSFSVVALIVVMLGCSGLYVWWNNLQIRSIEAVGQAEVSQPQATAQPLPALPSALTARPATSKPAGTPATNSPAPVAESSALLATQDASNLTPITADDVQIEIAATEETWVSVTPDGKEVFSGILQPTQVRTLGAHDSALIRIGNAGGLSVRLNGKPIGPIGQAGQVRTLLINKAGFQIIETKPMNPVSPAEGALYDRAPVAFALNQ